jgi:glutamate racemase
MTDIRQRNIGIFDSGLGGLNVMQAIAACLPHENITYFGDTAHLPYGNKSSELITTYVLDSIDFLLSQDIKLLIIACHTVCATCLELIRNIAKVPTIAILEQAVEEVVDINPEFIAILGTRATIASETYRDLLYKRLPGISLSCIPCPLFVPLIEEGYFDHPITQLAIAEYLSPLMEKPLDAILLGCTHYPLIQSLIRQFVGNKTPLLDPANRCAQTTRQLLSRTDQLNHQIEPANYQFFVSQDPERFSALSEKFFKHPIKKTSPLIRTSSHNKGKKNLTSLLELKNKLNLSLLNEVLE